MKTIRSKIIISLLLLIPALIQAEQKESTVDCQCTGANSVNGKSHSEQYATLAKREIGKPVLNQQGERELWPRKLPFFAQEVLDLGFELPKTFGLAIIPNTIQQDLLLNNLKVGINGGDMVEIDFVNFGRASADNTNVQIKADVWLFPFLNLYATYGKMHGSADAPIAIKGDDLIEFLGGSCDGFLSPKACEQTFSGIAHPEYTGTNISIGFNLAMGWDRFFVTLPITYVSTNLDILADDVTSLQISPRIGITSDIGQWGTMATFVGITYLDASLDVAGKITLDTASIPGESATTELDFIIHQENADKFNYLIGFNWDVSKSWSFHAEAGFCGSRESFIASTTYRF